jgi:hypothetical protein
MTTGKQVDSLAHYKQYCFFNRTRKHCCIISKLQPWKVLQARYYNLELQKKDYGNLAFPAPLTICLPISASGRDRAWRSR